MAGRDFWVSSLTGLVRPGYMTHAELKRELATASGGRRAELVREAQSRMKVSSYPRDLLMRLGIRPED